MWKFQKDLIQVKDYYESQEDYFQSVSMHLMKREYVRASFFESLMQRERNYPTGLQLEETCVAIPHTDSKHIIKEFIHITTLNKGLKFHRMDEPGEEIEVSIIFLLGMTSGDSQIETLSKMMNLLQNKLIIDEIKHSPDTGEIIEALNHYWNNTSIAQSTLF